MKFDITADPPSAQALADEARDLEEKMSEGALTGWRLGLVAVALVVAVAASWRLRLLQDMPLSAGALTWTVLVAAGMPMAFLRHQSTGGDWRNAMPFYTGWALVGSVCVFGALGINEELGGSAAATFLLVISLFLTLDVIFGGCSKRHVRREALRMQLSGLGRASPEKLPVVVRWCEDVPEIAAYQGKVASLGRDLVSGEVDAMWSWIAELPFREELERQRQATERLRAPIRPA